MPPRRKPAAKKAASTPSSALQSYLLLYNGLSLAGWASILATVVYEVATTHDYRGVFDRVWPLLQIVQTAAVLEVIHSAIGWVRSPVLTTMMQVASRLFLVWGINALFPAIHSHWSFTTMVTAWSIADGIRYMYYGFNLASAVPSWLTWLRYNLFLVLYPAGVGSELTMAYLALPYAHKIHPAYYYVILAVALTYLPGFPMLFSHMLAQRKKIAGTSTKTKRKTKSH